MDNLASPGERSRNAQAQARHRAKRKAYIKSLEQKVLKLQAALDLSDRQVEELHSPASQYQQVHEDNLRLRSENETLRRELSAYERKLQQTDDEGLISPVESYISAADYKDTRCQFEALPPHMSYDPHLTLPTAQSCPVPLAPVMIQSPGPPAISASSRARRRPAAVTPDIYQPSGLAASCQRVQPDRGGFVAVADSENMFYDVKVEEASNPYSCEPPWCGVRHSYASYYR